MWLWALRSMWKFFQRCCETAPKPVILIVAIKKNYKGIGYHAGMAGKAGDAVWRTGRERMN
jgi:hypothetical protein